MNKIFKKVAVLSVGLTMAIGAAVALNAGLKAERADAAKGDVVTNAVVDLTKGDGTGKDDANNVKITWSLAGGKISIEQLRASAGTAATGETTFSAVNTSYISAPRAYRGHIFAFTGIDDFKITSVRFTYVIQSGNGAGLGLICGDTLDDSAELVATKNKTKVTGAIGVVSDTTNYSAVQNTSAKTWTVTCGLEGGTSALYAQNYDNNDSTASTQLRPTTIEVSYIVGDEAKVADEVQVSGESALSVGQSSTYSAVCLSGGESTDVDQTVTWSVSNSSILAVDSNGKVTALHNGTANVIATSSNSIAGSLEVSVSDGSSEIAPKTFAPSFLGMEGTSYAPNDGFHTYRGFVVETSNIALAGSDYVVEEEVVAYQKDAFMFRKSPAGYFRTSSLGAAKISAVSISGCSTTAPGLTIAGGDSINGTGTAAGEVVSVGKIHRYEFATPVNYVTLTNDGTATVYVNSITFEFVGGVESVDSLADYILGLVPDRSAETGMCLGEHGNYEVAKAKYAAALPAVRSAFETSEDATVASARERYVAWAAAYGDTTPFAEEITKASSFGPGITSDNNSLVLVIAIISGVSLVALSSLLILKKKRK